MCGKCGNVIAEPKELSARVVLVGKSLKVTIPKEIVNHLNLKKGDTVLMWVDNKHIIAEKKGSR